MNGNKYEQAVSETRSVLAEWMAMLTEGARVDSPHARDIVARNVVDRLVAKGIIQSTDPQDLVETGRIVPEPRYRTGPLQPGRTVVGDDDRAQRFQEAKNWALTEHAETLRRLGADWQEGDD